MQAPWGHAAYVAAHHQGAVGGCAVDLPRLATHSMNARIKRAVATARGIERYCAGNDGSFKQAFCCQQGVQGQCGGDLRAIDQRQITGVMPLLYRASSMSMTLSRTPEKPPWWFGGPFLGVLSEVLKGRCDVAGHLCQHVVVRGVCQSKAAQLQTLQRGCQLR